MQRIASKKHACCVLWKQGGKNYCNKLEYLTRPFIVIQPRLFPVCFHYSRNFDVSREGNNIRRKANDKTVLLLRLLLDRISSLQKKNTHCEHYCNTPTCFWGKNGFEKQRNFSWGGVKMTLSTFELRQNLGKLCWYCSVIVARGCTNVTKFLIIFVAFKWITLSEWLCSAESAHGKD